MPHAEEQQIHDRLNLNFLVKKLKESLNDGSWSEDVTFDNWIKTRGALQKVKYAKQLLKSLEGQDVNMTREAAQRYQGVRDEIQNMEQSFLDLEKRTTPKLARMESILPRVPPPPAPSAPAPALDVAQTQAAPNLLSREATLLLPVGNSPQTVDSPTIATGLVPPNAVAPPNPSNRLSPPSNAGGHVLSSSSALHSELSAQIASMATQLKRNAIHFSESLEKDQAIVLGAQEKIEANFETMKKERLRLRDHTGKNRGTTCFVMMSLIVVIVSFMLMMFIIRWT